MAIIGIVGKMQVGKDTTGEIIQNLLQKQQDTMMGFPTWEIKKFAESLKNIASIILGEDLEKFESIKFKESNLKSDWNMTVRNFLQKLGVACREGVHINFWINALFSYYQSYSNWIITDCRFLNEAAIIKEKDGILIKLIRPSMESTDNHISETELDSIECNYIIVNDGTISDLEDKIKNILIDAKLLTE